MHIAPPHDLDSSTRRSGSEHSTATMRTILVATALGLAATHKAVSAVVAKASCSVDDASKSDCGFIGIDQVRGGRVGGWGCGGVGLGGGATAWPVCRAQRHGRASGSEYRSNGSWYTVSSLK